MMNRVAVFWDIDGTLLTTARAGVYALEAAAREVVGCVVDLHDLPTAGLTDSEVAEVALRAAGAEPSAASVETFLRVYERELPTALSRRRGRVMPQVRDVLDDLRRKPVVRCLLLTGNTPAGAEAKLRHYGLAEYFSGGAFCAEPGPRAAIARKAHALAEGADIYVIGDTPSDISAGKAIGARTIAVATGAYDADELARHEPWAVVGQIPPPPRFRELIGAPR